MFISMYVGLCKTSQMFLDLKKKKNLYKKRMPSIKIKTSLSYLYVPT